MLHRLVLGSYYSGIRKIEKVAQEIVCVLRGSLRGQNITPLV